MTIKGFGAALMGLSISIAVFVVYWTMTRNALADQFMQRVKQAEYLGYDIRHRGLSIAGFPFSFDTNLGKLTVNYTASDHPFSFRGTDIYAHASAFIPFNWTVMHRGDARFDLRSPAGARWLFDIRPFQPEALIKTKINGRVKTIELMATRLRLHPVIGTHPPLNAIENFNAALTQQQAGLHLSADATDIFLPQKTALQHPLSGLITTLGPHINQIYIEAMAVDLAGLERPDITSWQTTGEIDISQWRLHWEALNLQGRAKLLISQQGLSGTINVEVGNINTVVDILIAAKFIPEAARAQLRGLLTFLPDNQAGRKNITLTLKDGQISVFGQTLYRFAP